MNEKEILEKLARNEMSKEEAEGFLSGTDQQNRTDKENKPLPTSLNYKQVIIVASVHTVLYLALIYPFLFVIPKFKSIFEEMNIALPAITVLFVNISNVLVNYGIIIIPALWIILLPVDMIIYALLIKVSNPWLKRGYLLITIVFFIVIFVMVIISLILPQSGLNKQLGIIIMKTIIVT